MVRSGTYDHMKCGCCGVPLEEHSGECFRHEHLTGRIAERRANISIEEAHKARNESQGPSQAALVMQRNLQLKNQRS